MAPLTALLRSSCVALLFYLATGAAAPSGGYEHEESVPPLTPSDEAIQRRAFSIFNAVHSATRQWGSSLNHNGMSIFLATVPGGQLLYHGGDEPERAKGVTGEGFDWLAFELEHAQMFARCREGIPPPFLDPRDRGGPLPQDRKWNAAEAHYNRRSRHRILAHENSQKPIGDNGGYDDDGDGDDDTSEKPEAPHPPDFMRSYRGHFHTYRANRPLNLLYIDGMSAGNSDYGNIDTQDMMLLGWPDDHAQFMAAGNTTRRDRDKGRSGWNDTNWGGELDRARDLCSMAKKWAWNDKGDRIDGFVRTEAGFEIIYCDLSDAGGLDLVSIQPSPFRNETGGLLAFVSAEFLRGVSLRYHGFPAGRIHVDWSSMVSAFFYDVNLTNPDASRPELPRLSQVTSSERRGMRARVREVVAARGPLSAHERQTIDWQGIVDVIVTRFSQRLNQLARGTTEPISETVSQMLPTLLYAYINFTNPEEPHERQLDRCTQHYLLGALAKQETWTREDRSIYLALETVTRTICRAFFDIRSILYIPTATVQAEASGDDITTPENLKEVHVRSIVNDLIGKLQWTTWRECDPCQHPDEVCLVAMFPWGNEEDHFHPRCSTLENIETRSGYWPL
ncbi:uncharacterized protein SPSK_08889 [Sporothrix schenckii 1099-18]|uniref:Uncharacterized protein n=1 Tax=Sporothrix schenckii 1099-18 TaxID=1397361 RepID=A0A0F2M3A7_SPOSC|nr:uncharacterized protein SPSK_08889 [Sporothrix schenckii 1099-18]KJR84198.1 hypothetical protein SPSK_08889 [Sporothrix schenckii 1099-18]